MTFWENACNNARNKDLQDQLDSVVANCSLTVRRPARVYGCQSTFLFTSQISAYCITAFLSGFMLYRWRRGCWTRSRLAAVLLAPIRLVLRAYGLRELRGCCDVGSLDAVPSQSLQSKPSDFFANSKSIAEFGGIHVACRWALRVYGFNCRSVTPWRCSLYRHLPRRVSLLDRVQVHDLGPNGAFHAA